MRGFSDMEHKPRRKDIDTDTIVRLYVEEKIPVDKIAEILGCCTFTVCKRLRWAGVKVDPKRRIRLEIDKETLRELYVNQRMTLAQIAKMLGCGVFPVRRARREARIRLRPNTGKGSRHWKGGKIIYHGFMYVYNPLAGRNGRHGYIGKHRLIASKALGRVLNKGEMVHHIDGDKLNNRKSNLLVCTVGYHTWLEKRMAHLYQREHFGGKKQRVS